MRNAVEVVNYLLAKGINSKEISIADHSAISVEFEVLDRKVEFIHFLTKEIMALPVFYLSSPSAYGNLAHVTIDQKLGIDLGYICVNDRDSVSVNFSKPILAIEESLHRHIAIITKAISDPEWNRSELLREFRTCWLNLCDYEDRPVLLANENRELAEIDVYKPANNKKYGLNSHYLVQSKDTELSPIAKLYWTDSSKRQKAGKAIVIPLANIAPAPLKAEELANWYIDAIDKLPTQTLELLQTKFGRWRTTDYYVVFNATVPSGVTWFALALKNKKKQCLPTTSKQLQDWKLKAIPIRHFNKEAVLPRGGANLSLASSKVALVGAGSVGCEIAHKLSAAGVQNLDIYDPDIYSIDNLYRHLLTEEYIHCYKSSALSFQLKRQFLWSKSEGFTAKLLDLRKRQLLMSYDLIVIAIGSPTHERLFKEYLIEQNIDVPVINTWLEGFGVGGHATLDMQDNKGCLLCSYVCPDTLARGLSSNLNFIESNQNITINLSGCGEQFISYGAICSAQTALIASDLAIRFLEEKISSSYKVSWKGSDSDAMSNEILLTDRYYQFDKSLQLMPLHHEDCDVCS